MWLDLTTLTICISVVFSDEGAPELLHAGSVPYLQLQPTQGTLRGREREGGGGEGERERGSKTEEEKTEIRDEQTKRYGEPREKQGQRTHAQSTETF